MRRVQNGVFTLGVAAFLASAFFIGGTFGDTLWRTGVAAMLTVLASRDLFPTAGKQ